MHYVLYVSRWLKNKKGFPVSKTEKPQQKIVQNFYPGKFTTKSFMSFLTLGALAKKSLAASR